MLKRALPPEPVVAKAKPLGVARRTVMPERGVLPEAAAIESAPEEQLKARDKEGAVEAPEPDDPDEPEVPKLKTDVELSIPLLVLT